MSFFEATLSLSCTCLPLFYALLYNEKDFCCHGNTLFLFHFLILFILINVKHSFSVVYTPLFHVKRDYTISTLFFFFKFQFYLYSTKMPALHDLYIQNLSFFLLLFYFEDFLPSYVCWVHIYLLSFLYNFFLYHYFCIITIFLRLVTH